MGNRLTGGLLRDLRAVPQTGSRMVRNTTRICATAGLARLPFRGGAGLAVPRGRRAQQAERSDGNG
jgi:hypothetical protein